MKYMLHHARLFETCDVYFDPVDVRLLVMKQCSVLYYG